MIKKIILFFVLSFVFVSLGYATDTMTMLKHREQVNKLICAKKVECQEKIDVDTCINTWNTLADIEIKEINNPQITTLKSVKCRNYIRKKATCDNLTKIYKEGDCSLSFLTAE